jgi:hypothetical protein
MNCSVSMPHADRFTVLEPSRSRTGCTILDLDEPTAMCTLPRTGIGFIAEPSAFQMDRVTLYGMR